MRQILSEFRLLIGVLFLILSVCVDFTSKFLSVLSDGLIIGAAAFVLYPIIKSGLDSK